MNLTTPAAKNPQKNYLELYLDYANNFLTLDMFAVHHGLSNTQAESAINTGRMENNLISAVDNFFMETF